MARDTDYVLSLLLENGLVTRMQADQAADQAMLSDGLYDTVDILVNSGVLDEAEMTALLAQQYGMEVVELTGYEIPEEYNEKIKNLPASYKRLLEENIGNVQGNDDPLSKSFVKMMDMFEDSTGLNLNNILFNSLKILGTD